MASEGTNSNVLAAVAHARLVFDNDKETATELSRLGVLANASNPLAWSSWANALLNADAPEKAMKAAKTAQFLARDTSFRYWTEFQVATTAVALGHTTEAIAHSERARALNARYRPAIRYLIGMHSQNDDFGTHVLHWRG